MRPTPNLNLSGTSDNSNPNLFAQTDKSLDIGGRILGSVVKPYPAKVAGVVRMVRWEGMSGVLEVEWVVPPAIPVGGGDEDGMMSRETEIYFPDLIARGRKVMVEGVEEGCWKYARESQTIFVLNPLSGVSEEGNDSEYSGESVVKIKVWVDPPLTSRWNVPLQRGVGFAGAVWIVLVSGVVGLIAIMYLWI